MLDREIFLRPYAHRGLHNTAGGGLIENTGPAFEAAIAKGYGIECDIRPGRDGLPLVFHDATTKRLMDQDREVATVTSDDLGKLAYKNSNAQLLSFADFLSLVAGRVPLLVEIKSEWETPDPAFIQNVAELANAYHGAIACKSFDPAMMMALRIAPLPSSVALSPATFCRVNFGCRSWDQSGVIVSLIYWSRVLSHLHFIVTTSKPCQRPSLVSPAKSNTCRFFPGRCVHTTIGNQPKHGLMLRFLKALSRQGCDEVPSN